MVPFFCRFIALTLFASFIGLMATNVQAASGTWTNLTSGGLWSDANNWSGGVVADGSGFSAIFTNIDITTDNIVHMNGSHTLTALSFGDTSTNTASGWIVDNNGNQGNILTLAGAPTITVNALGSGKTATIGTVIDGTAGITFNGTGTLVLTNANTYSGTSTINGGGAVRITRADSLGSSGIVWANSRGQLELDGSGGSIIFTKNLGSTSGYIIRNVAGTNTVTSGGSMYSGAGYTQIASDGGVLLLTGNFNVGQGGRKLQLMGTSTDTNTFSGSCSGGVADGLQKSGSGTWLLSGANTTTGDTLISGGTLVLANQNAAQNSTVTMSGGKLVFSSGVTSFTFGGLASSAVANRDIVLTNSAGAAVTLTVGGNDSTNSYAGVLSGKGSLTKNGAGILTLSTNNSYSGDTTVNAGTLNIGAASAISNSVLNLQGGALIFGSITNATFGGLKGVQNMALSNSDGNAVALTVGGNGGNTTFSGILSGGGSIIKNGTNTLTLSGVNTYTGNTMVNGGTLNIINACLCTTSSVYIAKDAKLALSFVGTATICSLYLNGEPQTPDTYGAGASCGAYFSGSGKLQVTNGPPARGTVLVIR